jgi:radical SAM family uncharacterized protein
MPGQYVGGELNSRRVPLLACPAVKGALTPDATALLDKPAVAPGGKLCLAFPDTYAIGMSHHGLQVLYDVVNRLDDWVCERVFTPWTDMEQLLREHRLPLYSLESFTPLSRFDILGFTLQYELCSTNVLTILDLGGIPLSAAERTDDDPLVIAGGPCVVNPEPMSRFIDVFVLGDGEEILPQLCREWLRLKHAGVGRAEALARLAAEVPHLYVPRFYEPPADGSSADGSPGPPCPTLPGLPEVVTPAVVADLDAAPLPTAPVVPYVECVQDRIAIEIMRGCPWRCRFCQSTVIKRPMRVRRVETIVQAAVESYKNTGYNEISLLSLSTSDYPDLEELMRQLQETFRPLGVSIAVPSLRVGPRLDTLSRLLNTDRRSGLTLAPEAARDDMRRRIGKRITNDDLYEGCRSFFAEGFERVKLYFMCGLPGEEEADLEGIIEMAETIARLGKESLRRPPKVVVNVSNFVPKPHTPLQRSGMQTREYFHQAHRYLRGRLSQGRRRMRNVQLKCHGVESSLLEAVLGRGDRRVGEAIEAVWHSGARLDAWSEHIRPELWWQALAQCGVDVEATAHRDYPADTPLPWDHIGL